MEFPGSGERKMGYLRTNGGDKPLPIPATYIATFKREARMAQPSIVPMAKALYICDGTIGFPNQKTDVMGLFNAMTPQQYPYVHPQFVAFAQLSGGLGPVSYYFDVRIARTGRLAITTNAGQLNFATRIK